MKPTRSYRGKFVTRTTAPFYFGIVSLLILMVLWVRRAGIRYERATPRRLAEVCRRMLPWRRTRFVAPLLGLFPLTWQIFGLADSPPGVKAVWMLSGLLAVEVLMVHVRRESWIAAYEPWWITAYGSGPAEPRSREKENYRLVYLLQAHALTATTILISLLGTNLNRSFVPFVICLAMAAKYSSYVSFDFEGIVHWDMHCRVLTHSSHRLLPPAALRVFMEYLLGPLCGYVPNVYAAHHLLIHHAKNGGPGDIHSCHAINRWSFLEFSHFAVRVASSTILGTQLVFHRRCRRKRPLLLVSVVSFLVLTVSLVVNGSALGYWLLTATIVHGVDVARSQIAWHGLLNPGDERPLFHATVNWINRDVFAQLGVRSADGESLVAQAETRSIDPAASNYSGVAPHPSSTWAFNDNLHQIHHLHSSMHFVDYPAALVDVMSEKQLAPITMDLAKFEFFPERCWRRRFGDVADTVLGSSKTVAPDIEAVQTLLRADPSTRSPFLAAAQEVLFCQQIDVLLSRFVPMK